MAIYVSDVLTHYHYSYEQTVLVFERLPAVAQFIKDSGAAAHITEVRVKYEPSELDRVRIPKNCTHNTALTNNFYRLRTPPPPPSPSSRAFSASCSA